MLWLYQNGLMTGFGMGEGRLSERYRRYAAADKHPEQSEDLEKMLPPVPADDEVETLTGPHARNGIQSAYAYGRAGQQDGVTLPATPATEMGKIARAMPATSDPARARNARAPKGFALAQLLPGRLIRLTAHTPHCVRWKPGQHVLLTVPSVEPLSSHPFTIASAVSACSPSILL
jgi:hypothetical protein